MEPSILLSILGYEEELSRSTSLENSEHFLLLKSLLKSVHGVHIDLIRPPYSAVLRFKEDLVESLCLELSDSIIELHVMSENPAKIFESVKSSLVRTSSPAIFMHLESFSSNEEILSAIKKVRFSGCKAGMVLDLPTPIDLLKTRIVDELDAILVMSVKGGGGGRKFDPNALMKIRRIKELFPFIKIEVDGGIDEESGRLCVEAGADVLVVGSRITRSPDPFEAVDRLKKALKRRSF